MLIGLYATVTHDHRSENNEQKSECSERQTPQWQALSGDFQGVCGKMHAQILLGVRWCTMSIFLFLKLYNFDKGITRTYSILKKPKTNVFKCHLLTF